MSLHSVEPALSTTVRVHGSADVAYFRAMADILGFTPSELATDLVAKAIRDARRDPTFHAIVRQAQLTTVPA